jgi:hypothetical protein
MFAKSLHQSGRSRFLAAGLIALGAVLTLLVFFSRPADASAGSASTRHGLGALRPVHDVLPAVSARRLSAALPVSVDLSAYAVPVGNQGQIGSCVAWAIDYAMLGWYSRHDNKTGQPFNPMYTFSQIHISDNADGGGSRPADALNVALHQGNDTMAHYSHSTIDFTHLPNTSERANATNWKISGFQTLFTLRSSGGGVVGEQLIKTALASGKPVAIAFVVRQGFEDMGNSSSSVDDDVTSKVEGGHEVLALGYDQNGLLIQNSWGARWGFHGYGRLSWRVVERDVMQAHTISGFASPTPTPTPTNDTTPPTIGPVNAQFLSATATDGKMPVRFTWSANDTGGIAGYSVYVSTDGGAYVRDTNVASTATQYTYSLLVGHSYQLAVRAVDTAGNSSGYSYSTYITVR